MTDLNETSSNQKPSDFYQIIDFFNVYVSSLLVFIGIIGNLISLLVFARSLRHSPKIQTCNSFIVLTASNLMYLILVWYFQVLKRFYDRFYLMNSNVFVCKSVIYSINLSIALNALITVTIIFINNFINSSQLIIITILFSAHFH